MRDAALDQRHRQRAEIPAIARPRQIIPRYVAVAGWYLRGGRMDGCRKLDRCALLDRFLGFDVGDGDVSEENVVWEHGELTCIIASLLAPGEFSST